MGFYVDTVTGIICKRPSSGMPLIGQFEYVSFDLRNEEYNVDDFECDYWEYLMDVAECRYQANARLK